jgi:tetratricopeptide (TPR) repeat protein
MRSWRRIVRLLAGIAVVCVFGLMSVEASGAEAAKGKDFEATQGRANLAWERLQQEDLKPEEAAQLRQQAIADFRFALAHAPAASKPEDLNSIRYNLAFLYWSSGDYYDAAVLGEFLAHSYPDAPEAQPGARVALNCYSKLAGEAKAEGDRKFAETRMARIAEFITQRWPKTLIADEGWLALIRAAVANHDPVKTAEYLGNVSADSPRRGEIELFAGQSLWAAYLDAARAAEPKRPPKSEMEKMLAEAKSILEQGIARERNSADADPESLAAAALSLAQMSIEAGQAEKAVAWLDDPTIGPHTLIDSSDDFGRRGNFRVETLKAALRAYVATRQAAKAKQAADTLEASAGKDANLTRLYLGLCLQLEGQWKQLRAEGKNDEAAKLTGGFAFFLARLADRPAKQTGFGPMNWVAEQFVALGDSFKSKGGQLPKEAVGYYQKAAQTYRVIIEACRGDERFASQPDAVYVVQLRLARCLRSLGQYDKAIDALIEILKARNNLVDAQREAALTYQAWGRQKPDCYLSAIQGAHKVEGKDASVTFLVWGWGGIARKAQDSRSRGDLFHEARYNLAVCRYRYALSESGRQRAATLEQARKDIMIVYTLYPEMGGKQRYSQYDALLKQIQKQLGIEEAGLKGS